jgi:hypothetical protein
LRDATRKLQEKEFFMASNLTFQTYDRLNKSTSMSMGATDAVTNAQVQAVADALTDIIRGTAIKATRAVVTLVDAGAAGPSGDTEANRGSKWLLRMQDSVTSFIYTHEIGTANGDVLPLPSSDFLDLLSGEGLALQIAMETAWRSPAGNAGALLSVQQVNRALN